MSAVFENVLGQNVSDQLILDFNARALAPAMLFSGPPSSGKGSTALELGRVISCEEDPIRAAWNCLCPACTRHRLLIHPDLLCLGSRSFCAEIAASAATLLREGSGAASRILFIRSVRKLLARFNPVLWEDEPRAARVSTLVSSLDEELNEFEFISANLELSSPEPSSSGQQTIEKLVNGITKNAYKLEAEGMSDNIPIGQIRRAAWWSRLAPIGRGKLLILENADRMQDEARNSLLKILEEPSEKVSFVLCSSRPGSLIPTILSRLRVYRFKQRDQSVEDEVIRRVFRDKAEGLKINEYLDSFLPVSGETLENLAAFFAASAAYRAALISKQEGRPLSQEIILLGKFCSPRAEAAGFGRPQAKGALLIETVLERAEKFEIRSLFSRFLACLLDQVSLSLKDGPSLSPPAPAYNEIWKKNISWAENAVGLYRLRPAQALEKLFTDLSMGLAEL